MYPTEPQPQYGAPSAAPHSGPPMSGPPASGTPDMSAGYGAAPQAYQQQPVSAAPAAPRGSRTLTLGDLLAGVGGLVIFFFSFAPFVSYDEDFIRLLKEDAPRDFPEWFSAWSVQTFMGPLSWWPVLAGLLLIALTALRFALPRDFELVGMRFNHLQVGLSLFAFFVLFGYAVSGKYAFFAEEITNEVADGMRRIASVDVELSFGWGGYLMLVGSIVAVTGAVLNQLGVGPTLWPSPPKPVGYPQQGTVYGQPAPGYPQQQVYGAPHGYPAQPGYQPEQPVAFQQQAPVQQYEGVSQTTAQPVYDPAAYQQQAPPQEQYQAPTDQTTPPQNPGQQPPA